ncbi:hypothetical protein ACN47E_008070 [Coniothyrium glycines]
MVMRETDEQGGLVPAPLSKAQPPYPTTPSEEHPPTIPSNADNPYAPNPSKSPAFNFRTPEETKLPESTHDIDSDFSDDSWDKSDDDDDFEDVHPRDVPDALKPAGGKSPQRNALPDALRAGPPAGIPIKRSMESIAPMLTGASAASYGAHSTVSEHSNGSVPLQTNNPYLKMQTTGQSTWGGENSQAIWGDSNGNTQKNDAPVELPAYQTPATPTHNMHHLHLGSHNARPHTNTVSEQPPLIAINSPTPQSEHFNTAMDTNPWESSANTTESHKALPQAMPLTVLEGQQSPSVSRKPVHLAQDGTLGAEQQHSHAQELHTFEQIQPQFSPQLALAPEEEQAPALPPRRSQEETAPTMPPRPLNTNISSSPGIESPNTTMNRQRKEHYQIKHIRWYDYNKQGVRTSPILTQNANGPCPLLALVNALVLSTPAGIETALVDTLRTRETVSLGLLLDAVFDELMSGRRGDAAQALPDVSELYRFLLALHTGLNVNPMFVPEEAAATNPTLLTNRGGAFENTQDMKLYRTFSIPLVHGWLPQAGSEAYKAFERVAKSYETSQYVQFQEEELDAKLQSGQPLTAEEQQMFTDIHTIKDFLDRWPTQLTDQGLKTIRDNLQDGQVAILFRNDHFSTLIKDPRTGQLVTLVTDQGYSTHDEIVWESLVDVNGQGSQLFSGDFRSVDNSSAAQRTQHEQPFDIDDNQGWTTVPNRRGNQQQSATQIQLQNDETTAPTGLSRAEQEDHDLALALQLQEEEEDRERRETEQRARDNQASVNAIAAQSQIRPNGRRESRGEQAPSIPPRRNNITGHRPNNEPAPPPTYEEASTAPRYNPPTGHPANPNAPLPPQGSAYHSNTNSLPPPPSSSGRRFAGRPLMAPVMSVPGRPGRRPSAGGSVIGQNPNEEREKCVVM